MSIPDPSLPIIDHCPDCFADPTWTSHTYGHHTLTCPDCYDGADDAGPNLEGTAATEAATIEAWNEVVDDYIADHAEESRLQGAGYL